jgi:hypothetical protein
MRTTLRGALAGVVAVLSVAAVAKADIVGPIDFEDYLPGPVIGQDSPPWTGAPCAAIDSAVVANALNPDAPSSFATKSFRMSNAVVAGCFNDAFTPQTSDEAGESTAQSSPLSGGTRQPFYESEFTFASFTGALQPGLNVQVSPDRGDGARMSFVRMRHTAADLELEFFDVQGSATGETQPCTGCANFVATPIGTFDPTVPHTVRITMQFVDGPGNDIVQVFVDGNLVHTGGSWEDYYTLDSESNQPPNDTFTSRTVDSLLIRASGSATASTAGKGFLFDDVSVTTGPVPVDQAPGGGAGEAGAGTTSPAAPVAAVPTFTG